MFAPILAAVGAAVALLQDCTIKVERERRDQETRGTAPGATPTVA
jgi:hypothetical protein